MNNWIEMIVGKVLTTSWIVKIWARVSPTETAIRFILFCLHIWINNNTGEAFSRYHIIRSPDLHLTLFASRLVVTHPSHFWIHFMNTAYAAALSDLPTERLSYPILITLWNKVNKLYPSQRIIRNLAASAKQFFKLKCWVELRGLTGVAQRSWKNRW